MLGHDNPRQLEADQAEARGIIKATKKARYFARQRTVELQCLYEFHRLIFERSNPRIAGQIRDRDVLIQGSDHVPPPAHEVRIYLREFGRDLEHRLPRVMPKREEMDFDSFQEIVEIAAWAQHRICWIHPFAQGNGRCARLFCNLVLLRYGLPAIAAKVEARDRPRYLRALRQADEHGDYERLADIIYDQLEERYERLAGLRRAHQWRLLWNAF